MLFILFACYSCNHKKAAHSFNYWKTTLNSKSGDSGFIQKENIEHFYIHYFDVAWSDAYNMPVPIAEISGFKNVKDFTSGSFTPVVFIANSCFQKIDSSWCDSSANKINKRILFIYYSIALSLTTDKELGAKWLLALHACKTASSFYSAGSKKTSLKIDYLKTLSTTYKNTNNFKEALMICPDVLEYVEGKKQ